ncbi:hypothetical protein QYF36_022281 [Acer negundo]|nr:hypothetical protein QYF36_015999 [Acer negundo]KAK4834344.1 hypothetical protein QYF36_021076 [Acer negundo]KAK4858802.1 hypothetical protein QYF36_022281 [Acer negundo]
MGECSNWALLNGQDKNYKDQADSYNCGPLNNLAGQSIRLLVTWATRNGECGNSGEGRELLENVETGSRDSDSVEGEVGQTGEGIQIPIELVEKEEDIEIKSSTFRKQKKGEKIECLIKSHSMQTRLSTARVRKNQLDSCVKRLMN